MRTVEGIVAAHVAATERRRQGRPIWGEKLRLGDVFHNDDLSFIERRDAIVTRIKATRWYRDADPHEFDGLHDVVENLATEESPDDFDYWWDELYDLADVARVWIETIQ
jgi:hypothetical protein